jgi:hypothetical protein
MNSPNHRSDASPQSNQFTDGNDDSSSEDDFLGEWHPGDGVCPSTSQFHACYEASYQTWSSQESNLENSSYQSVLVSLEAFLNMLDKVPPFFHNPPKGVDLHVRRKSPLVLRLSLELETSNSIHCSQHVKRFEYLQCLGFVAPNVYDDATIDDIDIRLLPLHPRYLTTIILAWSYIISCRWVEILQQAGLKSSLLHEEGVSMTDCFWDIVTRSRCELVWRRKGLRSARRGCYGRGREIKKNSTHVEL